MSLLTYSQQTNRSMFYKQVVQPFLPQYADVYEYIGAKFMVLLGLFSFDISYELFSTPQQYWETLTYLVLFDLLAKNIYILYNEEVKWRFKTFIERTLYKLTRYGIVCLAISLISNQWEGGTNYLQHFVYMALCVLEAFSIVRHLRIDSYLVGFAKFAKSGFSDDNFADLTDEIDKQQRDKKPKNN